MNGAEWRIHRVADGTVVLQGLGAVGSGRAPARLDAKRSVKWHVAVQRVSLLLVFVRSRVQIRAP